MLPLPDTNWLLDEMVKAQSKKKIILIVDESQL